MQIPVKTRQAVLAPMSSRRSVGNHRSLSSKVCDFSTCRTHKRFTSDYQSISRIFIVLPLLVPCYKMEHSTNNIFKNDSSGDFLHSKQCKYKEIYFSKFSKVHKRKPTSLLAKVKSRCFFPISGRHVCAPQKDTNMAYSY